MSKFILRDGSEVSDIRLARLKPSKLGPPKLPLLVSSKNPVTKFWHLDRAFDQGQEGMCVGTGCGHVCAAEPLSIKQIGSFFSPTGMFDLDLQFCRQDIYWAAQAIDPYRGGNFPGAGRFSEGTDLKSGSIIVRRWDLITEFRWATTFSEIKHGLSYIGPVLMGIPWFEGMFSPDANGFVNPTGALAGYHCIAGIGIDMENKRILAQQSWGPNFGTTVEGLAGRIWFTFDTIKKLIADPHSEFCYFKKK